MAHKFPGRCCPGLIEGDGSLTLIDVIREFPGRCCPGLIEGGGRR